MLPTETSSVNIDNASHTRHIFHVVIRDVHLSSIVIVKTDGKGETKETGCLGLAGSETLPRT